MFVPLSAVMYSRVSVDLSQWPRLWHRGRRRGMICLLLRLPPPTTTTTYRRCAAAPAVRLLHTIPVLVSRYDGLARSNSTKGTAQLVTTTMAHWVPMPGAACCCSPPPKDTILHLLMVIIIRMAPSTRRSDSSVLSWCQSGTPRGSPSDCEQSL